VDHLRPPDAPLTDGTVVLRPIDERDLETIERASHEPDIANRFRLSGRAAGDYVAAYRRGWSEGSSAAFAVSEAANQPLGQVVIEMRDAGRADIGYWLLPEARGRGLATRALLLASRWALTQPGIARLQLWTSPDNLASLAVAERSGFQHEDVLRSYGDREDGSRIDAVFYSLLPSDLSESDR
jgi:RimJ/RimL family protein N-acetyltransferase